MKTVNGFRAAVLFVLAVIMPLEASHCAWMPASAAAVPAEAGHHAGAAPDCCSEATPAPETATAPTPLVPLEPCCCTIAPVATTTAPAPTIVRSPASASTTLAVVYALAVAFDAQDDVARFQPELRSESPPDPSTSPQSPRSPPFSA